MTTSRRLRFEILRRDDHACRYCGGKAPDVALTVDHVVPIALGGSDDPENLVAACKDCNAGKSSIGPDSPIVADVDKKAARWAGAMQRAADLQFAEMRRQKGGLEWFDTVWLGWHYGDNEDAHVGRPGDWSKSILSMVSAGLLFEELGDLVRVAMTSKAKDTWRYFCGCAWNRLRQRQEMARLLLEQQEDEEEIIDCSERAEEMVVLHDSLERFFDQMADGLDS